MRSFVTRNLSLKIVALALSILLYLLVRANGGAVPGAGVPWSALRPWIQAQSYFYSE